MGSGWESVHSRFSGENELKECKIVDTGEWVATYRKVLVGSRQRLVVLPAIAGGWN